MTTIPDDIQKAAHQLFNMSWRMSHSSEEQDACINAIARALLAERERCAAEIERLKAEMGRRGKELLRRRSMLANIADGIEDEGDRAYFSSTNDADRLREFSESLVEFLLMREEIDAIDWPKLARERLARAEKAEAEIAALKAENERLRTNRETLERALVWYGENARLARIFHSEGDAGRTALADDGGKRARAALEGK
jgi:cell division protein FtsB